MTNNSNNAPTSAERMATFLKYFALMALIVQTTSAVILTRWSKVVRPPDSLPYLSTTLVTMSELTKFAFSIMLVFFIDCKAKEGEASDYSSQFERWKRTMYAENFADPSMTLKLIVPAALYTLQNNLIYVALTNLEATTFQVGYQSKVITTAVLSVLILPNRSLSPVKWAAIIGLTLGIVMTQVDGGSGKRADNAKLEQNFAIGLLAVVTCAFSSAFAGVYFEKILKGTTASVWIRNTQLAFFSTTLAYGAVIVNDGIVFDLGRFFQGYDAIVWSIIAVQALGGLIVAVVVKYADNILKGFATAISIIVCGLCSWHLFGFVPSGLFAIGSMVVIGSTMLYSLPDSKPPGQTPVVSPATRDGGGFPSNGGNPSPKDANSGGSGESDPLNGSGKNGGGGAN